MGSCHPGQAVRQRYCFRDCGASKGRLFLGYFWTVTPAEFVSTVRFGL